MAEQDRTQGEEVGRHHTNPWLYSISIGFYAGVIWGLVRWLLYQMKFTTIMTGFAADPFFRASFLKSGWGILVSLGSYILLSIIAAFLYTMLLRRLGGPWPGICYGLVWWAVLFIIAGPMLKIMKPIWQVGWNTFFTELCVSLLWGVFIGYSISFEFTDESSREPIKVPS
ncbi:magnesium-transporting ATPase (P-type) [Paenibacillus castaneae]|uniref:YqhR family membrane protein n=1 Tax=Paenibacillus castaneae TaxID=474957 RepID=UPI000C9AD5FE|nr:YqhR family membrane protein [Paenibacillus castaneae]NIK77448.1 magnesium-transporting ATPase (P-type) [Paenibacillus castaneae]